MLLLFGAAFAASVLLHRNFRYDCLFLGGCRGLARRCASQSPSFVQRVTEG